MFSASEAVWFGGHVIYNPWSILHFRNWLTQLDPEHVRTKEFVRALLEGEALAAQEVLQGILVRAISMFDTGSFAQQPEKLYHGFILGLLVHLEHRYEVRSNPEAGYGRADVLIRPKQSGKPGAVLELKVMALGADPDIALASAAKQARDMRYADALRGAGVERGYEYALAFDRKDVFVALADDVLAKAEAKAKMVARKSLRAKRKTVAKRKWLSPNHFVST